MSDNMIYIQKIGDGYLADFEYDPELIALVKKHGHGSWDGATQSWYVTAKGVYDLVAACPGKISTDMDTIKAVKVDLKKERSRADGKINLEKHGDQYRAYFTYDKDLVSWVKKDGTGQWIIKGLYWKLSLSGVIDLLDAHDAKWFQVDEEILQDIETYKAEQKRIQEEKEAEAERIKQKKEAAKRREVEYWEAPAKQRLVGIKPIVTYDFKSKPYPHQIEAFNYILKWGRILVADEPGLGKTAESIYASDFLQKAGKAKKCLIICGVNTVKYTWLDEIKMHSDQKSILIDGSEAKRLQLIDKWKTSEDTYYAIINIEALRKETIFQRLDGAAECIICDEIHKAKNGKSKQGHALRALKAPYKIGLTGTPVDNKVEDLYNILSWLGAEKRSFYKFRDQYCILNRWGAVTGYRDLQSLKEQLSKVMIRRKKEDVVDLPEKIYKTEYVDLTTEEARKYRELQKGILDNIDKLIDMENPLSSIFHLREVTGGLYTPDDKNAKLSRIQEIIEEEIIPAGKKVIVFSKYEKVTEIYKRALSQYHPAYITGTVTPEKRQEEVKRFQNDADCQVCIGTIGAMGVGITLTAATTVIYADRDWTVSANRQAEDRAHRIGTTENINVITVVAKNTIDEHIEKVLVDKALYTDLIMEGADVVLEKDTRFSLIAGLLGMSEEELEKRVAKAKKAKAEAEKATKEAEEEKKTDTAA